MVYYDNYTTPMIIIRHPKYMVLPLHRATKQALCEIGNNTVQQFDRLSRCQTVPVANIPQPVCLYTPIPTFEGYRVRVPGSI